LDPAIDAGVSKDPHARLVHWRILGQTELLANQQRQTAITTLAEAIENFDGRVARCFEPRHALRVRAARGTYDFVICFACNSVGVWQGEKRVVTAGITGTQEPLDRILTAAKVPLAKSHR